MKKSFIYFAILSLSCISCKKEFNKSDIDNFQRKEISEPKSKETVKYLYQDGDKEYNIKVEKTPERAVLFKPYTTEIMLALGLEDKIVMGTTEGDLLPQFQKAYEKVPYRVQGHHANINREEFLLMKPDFVSGFPSDIKAETTGSPEELIKSGIYPFLLQSVTIPNSTLNDVFKDIKLLGKIFSVEDRANKLVLGMQEKLKKANFKTSLSADKKPKVMIMASIENGTWIYGSLVTDLINKAQGTNVYADVPTQYEFVSFESVLHRNPDIIFMVDIASKKMSISEKIKILKNDRFLRHVTAVKNNNLHTIYLEDIYPSVRNVDFIIKMNKIIYVDK